MKILESVEVSRIGREIRTQNTQSKTLETLKFQGLEWWMIRGSNWVDFFRRNAVSVEKKGDDIV